MNSTPALAISLAQINPTVGDIAGNVERIRTARAQAARDGAALVVTGELALAGYPPEDLVKKPAFLDQIESALHGLADETRDGGPAILLGAPWREAIPHQQDDCPQALYNAALLLDDGEIKAARFKHNLPNYGVFDEKRIFDAGPLPEPIVWRGIKLGVLICEDLWRAEPAAALDKAGAQLLLSINASPYEVDKPGIRHGHAKRRAQETGLAVVYVNLCGGQDELVFDGASFALDANGEEQFCAPAFDLFQETVLFDQIDGKLAPRPATRTPRPNREESIYRALVLGLHDYVDKNYFSGVLIGMSGGIDSALSAAVAVDALGPDRVHLVMMPSPYTSQESLQDADAAAALMGTRIDTVPIAPSMDTFDGMLKEFFIQHAKDTTEENIQARTRGLILMAISNKLGYMVLSTGNKSEMSVGYATLYGDMCGGYSVLKDVYKTTVFALARWRNANKPVGLRGPDGAVMPERIITKPPSAELKPDQTDQDTLPPYDVLDDILAGLVEHERSVSEIAAGGHAIETVKNVWRMLDRAEYKRRQAPPGVKISSRAFGRDRRYPITNGFIG